MGGKQDRSLGLKWQIISGLIGIAVGAGIAMMFNRATDQVDNVLVVIAAFACIVIIPSTIEKNIGKRIIVARVAMLASAFLLVTLSRNGVISF